LFDSDVGAGDGAADGEGVKRVGDAGAEEAWTGDDGAEDEKNEGEGEGEGEANSG
jgi:hypothetical protein